MPFDFALARSGVTQEQYDAAPRLFVLSDICREVRDDIGIPVGHILAGKDGLTAYKAGHHASVISWAMGYEFITGLDFMPSLDVSEAGHNSSGLMPSRKTGLAPETARAHTAANHPGLDVRATQYALAMQGLDVPHSSAIRVHGVTHGKVTIPGKARQEVRAIQVAVHANGAFWTVPHWDYIEHGDLEHFSADLALAA